MATLTSAAAVSVLAVAVLATSACAQTGSTSEAAQSTGSSTAGSVTAEQTGAEQTGTGQADETAAATTTTGQGSGGSGPVEGGPGTSIVPADGFESALALYDEGLELTDDDGGRQLFVLTSVGGDLYQVKGIDSSGELDPLCWQVNAPGQIAPSAVVAGTCDADLAAQQFTIVSSGSDYVISHGADGYLQIDRSGLVFADTDPTAFTIVDR